MKIKEMWETEMSRKIVKRMSRSFQKKVKLKNVYQKIVVSVAIFTIIPSSSYFIVDLYEGHSFMVLAPSVWNLLPKVK